MDSDRKNILLTAAISVVLSVGGTATVAAFIFNAHRAALDERTVHLEKVVRPS